MKRLLNIPLLLLLTAAIFGEYNAHAQPYYFRHYQVENGLSNNTVNCCLQDKNGFMWFGTKEGLNRFDGARFKQFNTGENQRSLYPDNIYSLLSDKTGTLWVGCQKGLYWFNTKKDSLVPFNTGMQITDAWDLLQDKQGQLWFISGGNVCRYNFDTHRLKFFPAGNYFEATSLCMTPDGTIWGSSPNGFIYRFNTGAETFKSFNVFTHSPKTTSYVIQKIRPAANNLIYVGTTSQGLKEFDAAKEDYTDILTYNPDKTTIFIRDILDNGNNEFWFATESGIFILQSGTHVFVNLKKKFADPYSLSDNAIYSLCKDKEGNIWAGTFFGGVNYYAKKSATFQKYFPDNTKNAISGNAVREICEDGFGNIWIGTEDAGLNKLNKATGAITHFEPGGDNTSIAYTNIHGLLATGNHLWIGTFEHGLDIMDIHTGKVVKRYAAGPAKNELKSNFTLCFIQTKAGNVFIGTANGLFKYRPGTDDFEQPISMPPHLFITSIVEDSLHWLWMGTHSNGVFCYNPLTGMVKNFNNNPDNKNSITNDNVNAVYKDGNDNTWICTEGGGLCRLSSDQKTVTRYTTKNGLPSNFIFKILEDNQKQLWITTSRGLVNYDPAGESFTIYTRANGLLNDQFNYHSGYKDTLGTLYFGSVKGMISFNPGNFLENNFTPPVYITGFQVHNKEVEISDSSYLKQSLLYTNKITLPYDHSSFSIDFAALSFASPEMTHYTYMMSGLDKEWTWLKSNRKVYFTNLAPGTYTFKVRVAAPGSAQPENTRELIIEITPPVWATWYAYLLYATAFTGLCYYLVRTYHNRIEDKKEKEIYEAKINFFTIVAHEIRTPLTLIKGPVENLHEKIEELPEIREDVLTMERNTNRLVALITQILDFRQTETKGFSVDFTKVNISTILEDEFLNFMPIAKKRNLAYTADFPEDQLMAMADEEALHKIFSNLLSNAVKYAGTKVNVELLPAAKGSHFFSIEISNDGYIIPEEMSEKIFEPFYRLKETIKQKGTGIGLALARSLAELHDGNLYLKEGKNAVNTFILRLPLHPQEHTNNSPKNRTLLLHSK